jgi:hypothetical protein
LQVGGNADVQTLVLLLVMLMIPAAAAAQDPTFSGLEQRIKLKQQVVVTEVGGGKTRGDVVEMTPSSITLRFHDSVGAEQRRTFSPQTVHTIRRSDRLWNGLLLGLGAGILASEIWTYQACGPRGFDSECEVIVTMAGLTTLVPAGAAAGALIDKIIGNNLIYASKSRLHVHVSPVVTPSRAQVGMTLTF